jgi:hypothetical protein
MGVELPIRPIGLKIRVLRCHAHTDPEQLSWRQQYEYLEPTDKVGGESEERLGVRERIL